MLSGKNNVISVWCFGFNGIDLKEVRGYFSGDFFELRRDLCLLYTVNFVLNWIFQIQSVTFLNIV